LLTSPVHLFVRVLMMARALWESLLETRSFIGFLSSQFLPASKSNSFPALGESIKIMAFFLLSLESFFSWEAVIAARFLIMALFRSLSSLDKSPLLWGHMSLDLHLSRGTNLGLDPDLDLVLVLDLDLEQEQDLDLDLDLDLLLLESE
jgi:hypothetical protein